MIAVGFLSIPLFFVLILLIRYGLNKLAQLNMSYLSDIKNKEERELMVDYLEFEKIYDRLNKVNKELLSSSNKKKYLSLFQGPWDKAFDSQKELVEQIQRKVYPDLHKDPSDNQLKRLVETYKGLDLT